MYSRNWKKHVYKCFRKKYSTNIDPKPSSPNSYVENLQQEWLQAKPTKSIPGPSKLQLFRGFMKGGDFHRLTFVDVAKLCRQRYGDLFVMPGFFGQSPNVITFNLNDYEKIFRTEGIHPLRQGFEAVTDYRASRKGEIFDSLGSSASGEEWVKYRHEVNPILMQSKSVQLYIDPLQTVNQVFIKRIREIRDPITQEVPASFRKDLMRFGLESLAYVVFDKQLGLLNNSATISPSADAEELLNNLDAFFKSFYDLGIKPSLYKFVKTPAFKRFERSMDSICNISYKLSNDKSMEKSQNTRSVLKELVKINPKLPPTVAVDSLLGGVEVTTSALAAILLCMATNQGVQNKLREEILNNIGKDTEFTVKNMRNLPYLRACIKESIRLYPLLFANLRVTGMDLPLSGYRITKGTNVLMASNMLLNEERYFPQPEKFIPERWLRSSETCTKEEEALLARDVNPFIYLPFGFGPRSCMGKRLAEMIMEMTLANIVRNFNIQYDYSTENAYKYNFVLVFKIPLKFKFIDIN